MEHQQQGEVRIDLWDELPADLVEFTEKTADGCWIVSHSENGNHHVLPAEGVTVLEQTKDVPEGMRILYAIVEKPSEMTQDALTPHEAAHLAPGVYRLGISREYDPFGAQARRVAD